LEKWVKEIRGRFEREENITFRSASECGYLVACLEETLGIYIRLFLRGCEDGAGGWEYGCETVCSWGVSIFVHIALTIPLVYIPKV
jgi:hypothetical protein